MLFGIADAGSERRNDMNLELGWRLVIWEVRHAVRGATFWAMVVLMALAPWVLTPQCTNGVDRLSVMAVAQVVALSWLVSLWTVFAVKRQLGSEVADDWLLVLTYRESLLSRYLAGLLVGLLLVVPAVLSSAVAMAWLRAEPAQWLTWFAEEALLTLSVVQPVAVATLVVAAADFMVAPVAVVLLVLVVFDTLWCAMPFAGLAVPMAMLPNGAGAVAGAVPMVFGAVVVCLIGLAVAWQRSEDFWNYLRVTMSARDKASLGAVRRAVETAQTGSKTSNRHTLAAHREWWRNRGVSPLWYHDLARYPCWFQFRRPSPHALMLWIAGGAIAVAVSTYSNWSKGSFTLYTVYFGFWITTFALLMRAVVSGAQIVVQEKEAGTLPHLLLAPRSATSMLWRKTVVIVRQAVIPVIALTVAMLCYLPGMDVLTWLGAAAICAAVGGVIASSVCGTRLLAVLVGTSLAVGLLVGTVATLSAYAPQALMPARMSTAEPHWLQAPAMVLSSVLGLAGDTGGTCLTLAAWAAALCGAAALVAWRPAVWLLRRQAAAR